MKLFRAESVSEALQRGDPKQARSTMRLPVNVPFIIDNLWEYLRPNDMPCRRHAVFASPNPALALQSASTGDKGLGTGVYEIVFSGPVKFAQLKVKDAKFHADIKTVVSALPALIAKRAVDIEGRQAAGLLFLPGATREDWSALVRSSSVAAALIDEIGSLSTFWADASLSITQADGEVFFELGEGASYAPTNLLCAGKTQVSQHQARQ